MLRSGSGVSIGRKRCIRKLSASGNPSRSQTGAVRTESRWSPTRSRRSAVKPFDDSKQNCRRSPRFASTVYVRCSTPVNSPRRRSHAETTTSHPTRFLFVRRSGDAQPGATVVVEHLADKVPGARCEVQVGGDGTFELHLFCRKRHHVSGVDSRVDLRFVRTMRDRVRWRAGMETIAGC